MGGAQIFHKIQKDRYYLLRSYLIDLLLMSCVAWLFINYGSDTSEISFKSLYLVIPGVIAGLAISSLLHNASHSNIRSALLNRVVGVLCGYWVLYGFTNFVLIHFLHHKYSDKDLDPVNPRGMSFLLFLSAPMRYMIRKTKKFLYQVHGNEKRYKAIMLFQSAIFHVLLVARVAAWYLVFGREVFLFFYLPGLAANIAVFAHINYVCHRDLPSGEVEILNLNHGYYFVANVLTLGGYFHKNHHLNQRLFDPRRLIRN